MTLLSVITNESLFLMLAFFFPLLPSLGPSGLSLTLNVSALGAYGKRLWVGTSGGAILSLPFISGEPTHYGSNGGCSRLPSVAFCEFALVCLSRPPQNLREAQSLPPRLVSLTVQWSKPRSAITGTVMPSASLSPSQVTCRKG